MDAEQIRNCVWRINGPGKVPVMVYATEKLFRQIEEGVFKQAKNVSMLPGIEKASFVMPDGHYGYGFPIGGVAAFNLEKGVISPGGVGYDINCGVRILKTPLVLGDVKQKLRNLVNNIFINVPSGVGSKGKLHIAQNELNDVSMLGAKWAVEHGYGTKKDLDHTEENGCIEGADPEKTSIRAKKRGMPELGTLGSGNHFLEIQRVEKIFDEEIAKKLGLFEDQITIMVHCGSRGFGHQIADDYIRVMLEAAQKYNIKLPDKELACAPINSPEARDYLSAMRCAVNFAFCNRQIITHFVRECFSGLTDEIDLVYDVCHNIAKFEKHKVDGEVKELCVHRKGATRAFAAGRTEIPVSYRDIGQPVIIPGSMGTSSYIMIGTDVAMKETFGSICHGAGRIMSRASGIRNIRIDDVIRDLERKGEVIKAANIRILSEESPEVYKDIDEVIKSIVCSGLGKIVAKVVPIGVTKG